MADGTDARCECFVDEVTVRALYPIVLTKRVAAIAAVREAYDETIGKGGTRRAWVDLAFEKLAAL